MKYILMMNTMRVGCGVPQWPQKDLQAHIAFMMGLNQELHERGELVSAEGLSFPDQAKLIRAGKDGRPITDGVFGGCEVAKTAGEDAEHLRRKFAQQIPTGLIPRLVHRELSLQHLRRRPGHNGPHFKRHV